MIHSPTQNQAFLPDTKFLFLALCSLFLLLSIGCASPPPEAPHKTTTELPHKRAQSIPYNRKNYTRHSITLPTQKNATQRPDFRMKFISNVQANASARYALAQPNARSHYIGNNNIHQFKATFQTRRIQLQSTSKHNWKLGFQLHAAGIQGQLHAVQTLRHDVSTNRITYHHQSPAGQWTEWYVNGPLGLEHGFTIPKRLRGDKNAPLIFQIATQSNLQPKSMGTHGIAFVEQDGTERVFYHELYAKDATGKMLPTSMRIHQGRIELRIDDTQATYPIVIDPLVNTEKKILPTSSSNNGGFANNLVINGNTLAIGAKVDNENGGDAGAVFVYIHQNNTWQFQQKVVSSDNSTLDIFGRTVDVDGDTMIVGAYGEAAGGTDAGAAYIFTRNSGIWTQQAKLTPSDLAAGDRFGFSVSISGETVAVSSIRDTVTKSMQGSVYVFTRSGTSWTQQAKLLSSTPNDNDQFGFYIALDGNTLAVGAWFDDGAATDAGAVFVFTRSGTSWTQQAKLVASDAAKSDWFGFVVDLDGDTLVTGALGADTTAGATGAAYVFTRSGTTWTQQTKLLGSDTAAGDAFGRSVAIDGDLLAVGAYYRNTNGKSRSGAAYLFQRSGSTWNEVEILTASDADVDKSFGMDVSIHNGAIAVGSQRSTTGGTTAGSAYIYTSCTSASLAASIASPQAVGTNITFTGSASCLVGAEYLYYIRKPGESWKVLRSWGASTYNWDTTGEAPGTYQFQVWVRSSNSGLTFEVNSNTITYTLTGTNECTNVSLSADATTQAAGTPVVFTANATCTGSATAEYKFWRRDPSGQWSLIQDWSTASSHNWDTTSTKSGDYIIQVWMRETGSSVTVKAYDNVTVTITGGGNFCGMNSLSISPSSPQTAGTAITLTAGASCSLGANAEHRFWIRDPSGQWTPAQTYSTNNVFNWDTNGAASGRYVIQVWTRAQGNSSSYESVSIKTFNLTSP